MLVTVTLSVLLYTVSVTARYTSRQDKGQGEGREGRDQVRSDLAQLDRELSYTGARDEVPTDLFQLERQLSGNREAAKDRVRSDLAELDKELGRDRDRGTRELGRDGDRDRATRDTRQAGRGRENKVVQDWPGRRRGGNERHFHQAALGKGQWINR